MPKFFILTKSLESVNETDLKKFEQKFNVELPSDYKLFLLNHNGGRPDRDVMFDVPGFQLAVVNELYGVKKGDFRQQASIDEHFEIFNDRIPLGFIPIGNNGSGDQILLATKTAGIKGVFFFDHENEPAENEGLLWNNYGNIFKVSNSFSAFMEQLQ
jgi:hypothetical protein